MDRQDSEIVEMILDPGETIICETGAFLAANEGIEMVSRLGQKQKQGASTMFKSAASAARRKMTGESLFVTHLTNKGEEEASVWLAAPYLGDLIPLDLSKMGGGIICQRGAFLAAAHGSTLKIHLVKRLGAGLFGGEGILLQKIEGDGLAVLHAGGSHQAIFLQDETLRIDTGCLVAFEPALKFTVGKAGGLRSMLFAGEGLFLAKVEGTGWVFLQSLPIRRLTAMLSAELAEMKAESSGKRRSRKR